MSNYVKSTNFTAKDSLPTGDTNKVIRGSEFDTEFNAIATAVATKSDLAGPTFTGTATFDGITATGTVNFTGGSVTTNIDGGTIDGVTIGGSTPGAGTFTAVAGTTGTFSGAVSGTTGTFSGAVTGSNLNVTNWNTAYGWGDHSTQGYLTSVTFSDIDAGAVTTSSETFANSDTQIPTNAAVRNWVLTTYPTIVELNDLTANVTWANVPDANITQSSVTQHQAALSISTSQLAGGLSLSDITDVTATATEVNYTDGVTSNIQTQLDSKVGANYTGDVDITGELLVDSYNETFKKVSSVGVTAVDVANASYDSKSLSVASQETTPKGIAFKADGTSVYMTGSGNDTVYQYNLTTAWDVSTGSYASKSFSVATEETSPNDVFFKSDGTKMYIVGQISDAVFQYSLSTAWDVSTASYDSVSFDLTTQMGVAEAIEFKPDGTAMFVLDNATQTVHQYSLSTAWDISTVSYDSKSFDVGTQENGPNGLSFTSDGLTMLVNGYTNDTVFQYALSTAWDVSTASYTSKSFATPSQETNHYGLRLGNNDTKLYIIGNNLDTIYQYSTSTTTYSTTFDCENANVFETELDANTTVVFSNPPASGTPVVTNYDIANGSYDSVDFSVATQETAPVAVEFSSDGTAMYVSGGVNPETVFQYTLSTAWDLSTASYASKSFNYSTQETTGTGLAFKTDGTVMYVVGSANDTVYQYTLSTAWDVSTASYASKSFSVATQAPISSAISFSPDGTKMYIIHEGTGEAIFQYTLSTAWDVSTASYASKTLSVASEDTAPSGMAFNSDGTQLFMCGRTNDKVYKYTLSTAYDLSTGSYDSVTLDISGQDGNVNGMAFKSDGSKMYIVGYANDKVYQYSTSSSSLNDSTAYAMSLKVVQDSGASGYTVTWPTSVDWPSATAPTLTATASAVDQFVFYTYDGGTTWYGFTAGQALG
jgi:sugar lactone lactonase YvrE